MQDLRHVGFFLYRNLCPALRHLLRAKYVIVRVVISHNFRPSSSPNLIIISLFVSSKRKFRYSLRDRRSLPLVTSAQRILPPGPQALSNQRKLSTISATSSHVPIFNIFATIEILLTNQSLSFVSEAAIPPRIRIHSNVFG